MQSRPRLTRALEEDILDGLTDPRMGADYDAGDMQRLIACAAAAVRHTARSRPRMSQVTGHHCKLAQRKKGTVFFFATDFSRTLTVDVLFP